MSLTEEERRRFAEITASLAREDRSARRKRLVRTAPQAAAIVCFGLSFVVLQTLFVLLTWIMLLLSLALHIARPDGRRR